MEAMWWKVQSFATAEVPLNWEEGDGKGGRFGSIRLWEWVGRGWEGSGFRLQYYC